MATILRNRGSDTEVSYASPLHTLLSGVIAAIGRPSQDGRKRRYRSSSDDSDEQPTDGFVTEDFRAGGPYLCGIPLDNFDVPRNHPLSIFVHKDSPKFRDRVRSILKDYNVDYTSFDICGRRSKFHPENSPVPTVLVHANRHELDNSWMNACRAISEYLKREGQCGVSVEITDPRIYQPLQYSSVLPTDDIFPVWYEVLDAILGNINLQDINSVGCYRVGKSLNTIENPPTVHIMVARGSSRPWKAVREAVVNILDGFNIAAAGVMIVNGEVRRENDLSLQGLPQSALDGRAQVGMSMGISNSKISSSTFGGFLEIYLPNPGRWTKLGLTCFHCVDPQNKRDVPPSFSHHKWGRDGVKPGDYEAPNQLQLDMPSLKDFNYELEKLDQHIKKAEKNPDYARVKKALDNDDYVFDKEKQHFDQFKRNMIDPFLELKDNWQKFRSTTGLSLGHVYAASGYQERCLRTVSNHRPSILDWALIQVNQSRMGNNIVGARGPPPDYPIKADTKLLDSIKPVPEIDSDVFKVGRSTTYTVGRYSGLCEAHVSEDRNAAGVMVKKTTLEHTVVGVGGQRFSDLGDSGSLVFVGSGGVAGMLFGGSKDRPISYITLTADLFDDIKRVTGATDVRVAQ